MNIPFCAGFSLLSYSHWFSTLKLKVNLVYVKLLCHHSHICIWCIDSDIKFTINILPLNTEILTNTDIIRSNCYGIDTPMTSERIKKMKHLKLCWIFSLVYIMLMHNTFYIDLKQPFDCSSLYSRSIFVWNF